MDALLLGYEVNRPTWFYLSTLLVLAVYFRFNRLWSLRNLDLALLLAGSPGLLFVAAESLDTRRFGQVWLFSVAGLLLLRLFFDPVLRRRPYLGQNLNNQGLGFLCISALAFLMTQAITQSPSAASAEVISRADSLLGVVSTEPLAVAEPPITLAGHVPQQEDLSQGDIVVVHSPVLAGDEASEPAAIVTVGPAAPVLAAGARFMFEGLAARVLAIFSHLAVISGLWLVGRNLFGDAGHGLAMATLYLLLPCTAYNVGEFNHVLPAACIVWALVWFRKPVISGMLLGLACGTMLFPVVLLPIWSMFYGRRGAARFGTAVLFVGALLFASFLFLTGDAEVFFREALAPVNLAFLNAPDLDPAAGPWGSTNILSVYRLPVMVAYFIMLICMTIWPRERTLETLMSQSAAAVLGTQLWYTDRTGVYLLWYLPLLLIVMFRPRLSHLVFLPPLVEGDTAVSTSRYSKLVHSGVASSQRLQLFR